MIQWNNLKLEEKFSLWKEFRTSLSSLTSDSEKILKTLQFFSSMPLSNRTIDYYTPESWPTPWEILSSLDQCNSSISLLLFHTLTMVGVHVTLCLINDGEDTYLATFDDSQNVLNYEIGKITTVTEIKNLKIIESFSSHQFKTYQE